MFRSEKVKDSGNCSPPSLGNTSKLLVTRRSWQAKSTWGKFPVSSPKPVLRTSQSGLDATTATSASPDLYRSDIVDGGPSSSLSKDNEPIESYKLLPTAISLDATVSLSPSPLGEHPDPAQQEIMEEFLRVHGFRFYQLVLFIFSMVTYLADVISDAYLVYSYYRQGDYQWSSLTLALAVVPALIMTGFSLVWYALDRQAKTDPPRTCRTWTLRLFFHGLQLAPIVRLADALYYGLASRRANVSLSMAVHYTQLMLYEDADSAMLRMIECFMEAAPQLLLQLYIIFTQKPQGFGVQIIAQAVSCATSWLSLAWSLTHYQCALRSSRVEKANLRWFGSLLFFTWKVLVLASRLLALSLFAALVQPLWLAITVGFHWSLAFVWLVLRGTTFCSPQSHALPELLFDFVLGAVYCFDVVNVREGHSRLWYLACYSVLATENTAMVGLVYLVLSRPSLFFDDSNPASRWLSHSQELSPWFSQVPFWVWPFTVITSFGLGIIVMVIYYLAAHPSGNIKVMPCMICVCFLSVWTPILYIENLPMRLKAVTY